MRVEKRIVLTKKELEAIKIAYDMYSEDENHLFDCPEDFIDFLDEVVRYDSFQNFTVVVEGD